MDIKHLEYFIAIVDSGCNLSIASKRLNISQPALSTIIKNFEAEEKIVFFNRGKGRFDGLTSYGDIFYKNAKVIVENYNDMLSELRASSKSYKGKIALGIPPLILTTTFSNVLPELIKNNPEVEFKIIEAGAYELRKSLISKDIDFAVLLQPTGISNVINEYLLEESELNAFVDKDSFLAKKRFVEWEDLNSKELAIFNNTFMIHHQILQAIEKHKIKPNISFMSSCWDYLLLSVVKSNLITILPKPIGELVNIDNIKSVPFKDPIKWQVSICQNKKESYSNLETYILESIIKKFNN